MHLIQHTFWLKKNGLPPCPETSSNVYQNNLLACINVYLIIPGKSIFFQARWSWFVFRFSLLVFCFSLFGFHLSFYVFRFSFSILTFIIGPNIVFWHSKSYFDIRNGAEYCILTFKILFWHSNCGQISCFDIQNPFLTFKMGPNIAFWHPKSYFDIRTGRDEYRIVTIKILLWHLNWDWISYFDIQNPILTFEMVLLKICQYIYPWSWQTCIEKQIGGASG